MVLLSGEPGIGKSRVTQELRERVANEPHTRLRYQCSPYHTNSAFYPVIDQLERAASFARGDATDAKLDKLEALLAQSTDNMAEVAPLFAALLSLPIDRHRPLNLSPQKQKENTIEALAEQVVALAGRHHVSHLLSFLKEGMGRKETNYMKFIHFLWKGSEGKDGKEKQNTSKWANTRNHFLPLPSLIMEGKKRKEGNKNT